MRNAYINTTYYVEYLCITYCTPMHKSSTSVHVCSGIFEHRSTYYTCAMLGDPQFLCLGVWSMCMNFETNLESVQLILG